MKTITQRIREAYRKSLDPVDRAGLWFFYFKGFWFDKAAVEHDQADIRIAAGVTDETTEEADENFRKNLEFDAKRSKVRGIIVKLFPTIVSIFRKIRK